MLPVVYVTKCLGLLFFLCNYTHGTTHDATFVPDFVLRATAQNVSQACINRVSVLLNGTAPGPELRLRPEVTTWIRVYNDIPDQNLTVVWSFPCYYSCSKYIILASIHVQCTPFLLAITITEHHY